jgi:hypothetical protein
MPYWRRHQELPGSRHHIWYSRRWLAWHKLFSFSTRLACSIAALFGIYVLGLPELWGKADHYHHLIWFAAILAASPCGDTLALDSSGRVLPERSPIYRRPLRYAWLVIGLIYFFPGLWKLGMGTAWWAGDNLNWQMYQKWFEAGFVTPALRTDHLPHLYRIGGLATVLFEVSFLPLVMWRPTRMGAVLAGLGFHIACAETMRIWFWILPVLYVMFGDWDAMASCMGWMVKRRPVATESNRTLLIVAMTVILAIAAAGLTRFDSWPVGIYPTFAFQAPSSHSSLELYPVTQIQTRRPVSEAVMARLRDRFGSARWSMLLESMARSTDSTERQRQTLGLVELIRRSDTTLAEAQRFGLYRTTRSVDPAHWGDPPIKVEYLGDVSMPTQDLRP